MNTLIAIAMYVSGVFTIVLGAAHFFFPILFDFENAIPREGEPLKPFRLLFIRYATKRSDVRGIAWVMNHATSYALVTIGLLDLLWKAWLDIPFGKVVALWIAGWWLIRAASQLYLGKRRGDWLILIGFAWLGVVHVGLAALG